MMRGSPDEDTIRAWLEGRLSEDEANRLETSFTESTEMDSIGEVASDLGLLKGAFPDEADPVVREMIFRLKSGLSCDGFVPREDAWREIVEGGGGPDSLGMLGRYEVIEVIATGGMAVVLKGYDAALQRFAALKVLSPEMAANTSARERFLREARAAALLEHENILPVYEVHDAATPWFAMRYVAGPTLRQRLERGDALKQEILEGIALQISAALEAAHARGIVHRDIKPENVLLEEGEERLWICDFGIARCADDPGLTYPGAIAGTPLFMSPEQAAGREVDRRSDYYSLGAVLYLCTTGRQVVTGTTTAAVLAGLQGEDFLPACARELRDSPAWWRALLLDLLQPDPERRLSSPELVRNAIETRAYRGRQGGTGGEISRRLLFAAVAVSVLAPGVLAQLPLVKDGINRITGSLRDERFSIADRYGVYPDLGSALKGSSPGDVILLPEGSTVPVDELEIPEGHPLTLRARGGKRRPVLTTERQGGAGILAKAELSVSGVDFLLNPERGGAGILIYDGVGGRLDDCRFFSHRTVEDSYRDTKSRALEVWNGASVQMKACRFEVSETNAVTLSGGSGSVSIDDCRIRAFFAVNLIAGGAPEGRYVVEADDSEIVAECFMKTSSGGAPRADLRYRNCRFDLGLSLCWFQTEDLEGVLERFHLHAPGSDPPFANASIRVGERGNRLAELLILDPAIFSETVAERTGFLRNETTGERYHGLAEAVAAAKPGEELSLSGTVIVPDEVRSGEGARFVLKGVEGSRPTLVAGRALGHALALRGPSRISGIRFSRHDPRPDSLPIVLAIIPEGEGVFEDCLFDALSPSGSEATAGVGLGLSDVASATVRRCVFRCGTGVYAGFVPATEAGGEVSVSDSLFLGGSPFRFFPGSSRAEMDLGIERTLFLTRHFLGLQANGGDSPLRVETLSSTLDVSRSYFDSAPELLREAAPRFRFSGGGNRYRSGVPVIEGGESGNDFRDFVRTLPDSGGWSGEPLATGGSVRGGKSLDLQELTPERVGPEFEGLLREWQKREFFR